MDKYDVAVIGAGPAGYVAAIRAAQLGGKVCVIEKEHLGGTCLNRGCIPSKAIITSVKLLSLIKVASSFGIDVQGYQVNFPKVISRKDEIVMRLRQGIGALFKSKKIDLKNGEGKVVQPTRVLLGNEEIEAKNLIIATGSEPLELPQFKFDGEKILSSTHILELKEVPKSLLILGGGVIGCEFACVWLELGVRVSIVEMMPNILPTEDKELGKRMALIMKKKGIEILTDTKVESIEKNNDGILAKLSNGNTMQKERVLVSVGRSFNSSRLGLEELGVKIERGRIQVDEYLRTSIPNIYAAGDVIGGLLLAHVASHEGLVSAENALGGNKKVNYTVVPNCIFTDPEIGSVGHTEDTARQKGYEVKVGRFPFMALGKAHALGETEGFVKLIGDAKTGRILGGQILGPHATDLIAEVALAMKLESTMEELEETIHAHPTLAEGAMEAAGNFYGRAIHIP